MRKNKRVNTKGIEPYLFLIMFLLLMTIATIITGVEEIKSFLKGNYDNNGTINIIYENNDECENNKEPIVILFTDEYADMIITQRLAKVFAQTHTHNETYNCRDYSIDFSKWLEQTGIPNEITARHKETYGHQWNKICISYEVQTQKIVNYKEDYPYNYIVEYVPKHDN